MALGILERAISWVEDRKSDPTPITPPTLSPDQIRLDIAGDAQADQSITVNDKTARQTSAVLCCARVIAEGLAQVPCTLFRERPDGGREPATDHPLFNLLKRAPNDWQTSFEFREQIGLHLVLTNNAFVYMNRVRGELVELYAFDPTTVAVEQASDMSVTYKVSTQGRQQTIPASDIWHIKGPSWNGYQGLDAIKQAQAAIGLALTTERYATKLFQNMARPSGILTTKPGSSPLTPQQRADIKAMWEVQYRGVNNAHKTALLPFDLDFNVISGTAEEAQLIETRRFLIEEICRFFRVLPIMVMQSGATSYASVEQLFQAHLTHTLMPWYSRLEQSAEVSLLTPEERDAGYTVRLNGNALLRGSSSERSAYYNTMITLGVMTVNEVRAKEDLDRSDDPAADQLRGAANLFGSPASAAPPASPTEETPTAIDEVSK